MIQLKKYFTTHHIPLKRHFGLHIFKETMYNYTIKNKERILELSLTAVLLLHRIISYISKCIGSILT